MHWCAITRQVLGSAHSCFMACTCQLVALAGCSCRKRRPAAICSLYSSTQNSRCSTASLQQRRRPKFVRPGDPQPPPGGGPSAFAQQAFANGMAPPERLGGPAENMGAALAELQQRMGAHHAAAAPVGRGARRTNDVEGDACVSSLNSMMHAMGEMSVGAGAGAVPAQPSVA